MNIVYYLIIFICSCFANSTFALDRANYTGSNLLHNCSDDEVLSRIACVTYIDGVLDSWKTLSNINPQTIIRPCVPDSLTLGQARLVMIKWLKENPNKLHLTASSLIIAAISENFPCR